MPKKKPESLRADQFRSLLQEIDALGFQWTANLPPVLEEKEGGQVQNHNFTRLDAIIKTHPFFLTEVGEIIADCVFDIGLSEELEDKVQELPLKIEAVHELILSPEYCSALLLKFDSKIPCCASLNWEVHIKIKSDGVPGFTPFPYLLVSLALKEDGFDGTEAEMLTFVADENGISSMIKQLEAAREELRKTREIVSRLKNPEDKTENKVKGSLT